MRDRDPDPVTERPVLTLADGRKLRADPGPCLGCKRWVETGRRLSGATDPLDPAWHDDGDFGCDKAPMTSDEGTGDHARAWDLVLAVLRRNKLVPE